MAIRRPPPLPVLHGMPLPRRWGSCPHPDEEILLADDSWIKAKDIRTGDKVKTLTAEGFKEGEYEITHAEIIDNQPRCEVFFKDSKSIISSYSHPYAVEDKGFVDAKDLEVGDHVGDLIVTDTQPLDWGPVVSLSVDKAETYMLKGGSEDKPVAVLSHNKTLSKKAKEELGSKANIEAALGSGIGGPWMPPIMPSPPRGGKGGGRPRLGGRPIRRPRLEGRPRKDLPKWLQGKFGGIGGLREKLLNVPFFEGRQFPTGIPEQLRQLPLAPPEWDQRMELYQQPAPIPTGIPEQLEQFGHGGTVVPRDPQQPAPINQFGGTVVPRDPQQPAPINQFGGTVVPRFGWDVDRWLPIGPRAPSPEEITQQRIDQVSQFEQEPMMEPRYGAFGGSAMNLPDYTTRTSRYPVVDWETLGPARFADARFDPQRTGYADTGMRSDSGRTYALPGGYAGGGIANLINYYRG